MKKFVASTVLCGVAALSFSTAALASRMTSDSENLLENNPFLAVIIDDVIDYIKSNGSPGGQPWIVQPPGKSVPEPATLGLLSLGILGMGLARRRKGG